jgi:dihydrofolate reductase
MAKVVAGLTMSVDGFVTDGQGGIERLYPDLAALQGSPYMNALIAETGSVVMGRRAFEMGGDPDWFVGNYEFQVPIFVVTHKPPQRMPKQDDHLTFTFVTDGLRSAVEQAKLAAGEKNVTVVGGVSVCRDVVREGLADELGVDVMPVILGSGRRFLEEVGDVRLEKIEVVEQGPRTALRFRVVR